MCNTELAIPSKPLLTREVRSAGDSQLALVLTIASMTSLTPCSSLASISLISDVLSCMRPVKACINDHCETAALLTRSGCLDRCVECQQVGLQSDATDHTQYVGDALGIALHAFNVVRGAFDFLHQGQNIH